ncbi:hypothetical protein D3C80_710130 [compost metagenome]
MRVEALDHMPWRIVAAGTAQHPLAEAHEAVIGLRLLPVQRADPPTVQGVVLQRLEARLHLFLGQVKPELDDQRAFIAQHLFQALGTIDRLVQHRVVEHPVDTALQHLAVPVAKHHAHAPLGRQLPPKAPGRRPGHFLIGLLVEGAHLDQARVHPFVEQLDRLALAGAFDAIDQHDDRKTRLLLELELGLEQGLAQCGYGGFVGVFIYHVADFGGFEHAWLPSWNSED